MIKFLVGIDEAGRGPLAGPVAVGVVVVPAEWGGFGGKNGTRSSKKKQPLFAEARDSKQLSPAAREAIFKKLQAAKKDGLLDFYVTLVSAKIIDTRGIVFAIRRAMARSLKKLSVPPHQTQILLDGSLYAPEEFLFQKTIIRGDQSEPVISLASIAAKVTRDRHMLKLAKKYPSYGFEIHKGYGTKQHREMIKKYGQSIVHRRSFLKGILGTGI
jgi:ribonuclease HII